MGFGAWGLEFWVWGLRFGVWGSGSGVWSLGFGVYCDCLPVLPLDGRCLEACGGYHITMPGGYQVYKPSLISPVQPNQITMPSV